MANQLSLRLHSRTIRDGLIEVLDAVGSELLIACPFIKTGEAEWLCDEVERRRPPDSIRLRVLTDLRASTVLGGSLDIGALNTFGRRIPQCEVISLPRLHAKVYVADRKCALVTSANLTPGGMAHNFEYGIGLRDRRIVRDIVGDLEAYGRLGTRIDTAVLSELEMMARELGEEYRRLQTTTSATLSRRFSGKLRKANRRFLETQVGTRTASQLFAGAILYALSFGPVPTDQLQPQIQRLIPDLCDDSVDLVINGQRFGKRWKHSVRNAQQRLKHAGRISFNGKEWAIVAQG